MIFYFSGTGNSRYAARQLAALTGDSVHNLSDYGKGEIFHSQQPFVFVAPVYVAAPALALLDFLKNNSFQGNKQAYFLMTCAGTMSASPAFCRKAAEEKGLQYMGTTDVKLPQNYIAYFSMKSEEENRKIIAAAQPVLETLAAEILAGKPLEEPKLNKPEYLATKLILKPYYRWFITARKFRVEEGCIGCGKCERVCPLGNIHMVKGLPQWAQTCTHCMACINQCPKDAIEYGKGSVGKIRYRGPEQILGKAAQTGKNTD